VHIALYFLLIVFFTYFYVGITFNPDERADDMKKFGGFIPASAPAARRRRPELRLSRITLPGSLYLGITRSCRTSSWASRRPARTRTSRSVERRF